MQAKQKNLGGVLFFGAVTLLSMGATALLAYETWALDTAHEPITYRVRASDRKHSVLWHLAMFAGGVLAGHLFWCDHLPWDKPQGGCKGCR
jgi:hypothetical protein